MSNIKISDQTNAAFAKWAELSAAVTERRAELAAQGWERPASNATLELVAEDLYTCDRCGDPARLIIWYEELAGKEPNCPDDLVYCNCHFHLLDMSQSWCTHCAHQVAPGIIGDIVQRDEHLDTYRVLDKRGVRDDELWQEIMGCAATIASKARPVFEAAGLNEATADLAVADLERPMFVISVSAPTKLTTI